jgi:hypothetical protein
VNETHVTLDDIVPYLQWGEGDWHDGLQRTVAVEETAESTHSTVVAHMIFIDEEGDIQERFQLTITEL